MHVWLGTARCAFCLARCQAKQSRQLLRRVVLFSVETLMWISQVSCSFLHCTLLVFQELLNKTCYLVCGGRISLWEENYTECPGKQWEREGGTYSTELEWTWEWKMWAEEVPILCFWSVQQRRTLLCFWDPKADKLFWLLSRSTGVRLRNFRFCS